MKCVQKVSLSILHQFCGPFIIMHLTELRARDQWNKTNDSFPVILDIDIGSLCQLLGNGLGFMSVLKVKDRDCHPANFYPHATNHFDNPWNFIEIDRILMKIRMKFWCSTLFWGNLIIYRPSLLRNEVSEWNFPDLLEKSFQKLSVDIFHNKKSGLCTCLHPIPWMLLRIISYQS